MNHLAQLSHMRVRPRHLLVAASAPKRLGVQVKACGTLSSVPHSTSKVSLIPPVTSCCVAAGFHCSLSSGKGEGEGEGEGEGGAVSSEGAEGRRPTLRTGSRTSVERFVWWPLPWEPRLRKFTWECLGGLR